MCIRDSLEHRGRLAHIGVADDDVQPAVLLSVSVRLIPGVDDGAGTGGRAGDTLPDVVSPLADAVCGSTGCGGDLARAAGDLAADQEPVSYTHLRAHETV